MDADLIRGAAEGGGGSVLVTVLETKGSAPRHAGAKMLLRRGMPLLGTVGGGRLEAEAMARAEALMGKPKSAIIEVEMLGDAALGADMICGGSSLLLVESLGEASRKAYASALAELEKGRRIILVKRIGARGLGPWEGRPGEAAEEPLIAILDETLALVGAHPAPSLGLDPQAARRSLASGKPILAAVAGLFYDPVLPEERLVILGAGHVGQALARLAADLDFRVFVVDDRPEMADPSRFPSGTAIHIGGYAEVIASLPFDASTYAVTLTRGHLFDLECARALMGRDYRYAGMIGSARKVRLVLEQLKAEGFPAHKVEALASPIGLDIGAETPAEIAVCILGEMIAYRRKAAILPSLAEARKARRG